MPFLKTSETLELIGDFPALDYPTYDCGHQGEWFNLRRFKTQACWCSVLF